MYRLYCEGELIGEDLRASEVGKIIGIDSGNVKYYADSGRLRARKYKVELDDFTEEQLKQFEDCCQAFRLLKEGKAVIRRVSIKGNLCSRTVRV